MPHILALHLSWPSCRLILFLSANAAFRAGIPRSAQVVCFWKELLLLLPMCRVKCCSHCLLCCEVACPSFPSRFLARSTDVTYVQVDSIVLWAVVLPGIQ